MTAAGFYFEGGYVGPAVARDEQHGAIRSRSATLALMPIAP